MAAIIFMLLIWLTYKLITEQDQKMNLTEQKNALEAQVSELNQTVNNYARAMEEAQKEIKALKEQRSNLNTAIKLEQRKRQIQHERIEHIVKKNNEGMKEIRHVLDSLMIINLEELNKGILE